MVCTVLTAADLFGTKLNYELDFEGIPSVEQLRQRAEQVFSSEANKRRPSGVPVVPFAIHRIQTFDDSVELWVDLVNGTQLQDYSQVYIFQKETPWHKEVQSKIPPPVKPPPPPDAKDLSPVKSIASVPAPAPTPTPLPLPTEPSPPRSVMPSITPTPMHTAAMAGTMSGTLEATTTEKIRIVYDEMDCTKSRAVQREDWLQVFERVQLTEHEHELFTKADRNNDGVVSFAEFQLFGELYPTVLDALYYRMRDFWLVRQQEDSISIAMQTLDVLREKEMFARDEVAAAAQDCLAKEAAYSNQTNEVVVAQSRERDALAVMEAAAQETERCRVSVSTNVTDLQQCKEQEGMMYASHIAGVREVETYSVKVRLAEDETMKANQRLHEIMKMLEEQQAEVERRKDAELSAAADLVSAEARARNLATKLDGAQAQTRLANDRLSVAESELTQAEERERECGVVHLQAREEAVRQLVRKEQYEKDVMVAKEIVALKRQDEESASMSVQAQLRSTEGLQDTRAEFLNKCTKTREAEAPLILQEVRLRQARDSLEAEEARLRTEHVHFHASSHRTALPSPRGVLPTTTSFYGSDYSPRHR